MEHTLCIYEWSLTQELFRCLVCNSLWNTVYFYVRLGYSCHSTCVIDLPEKSKTFKEQKKLLVYQRVTQPKWSKWQKVKRWALYMWDWQWLSVRTSARNESLECVYTAICEQTLNVFSFRVYTKCHFEMSGNSLSSTSVLSMLSTRNDFSLCGHQIIISGTVKPWSSLSLFVSY